MTDSLDLDALEEQYEAQKLWGEEYQYLSDWEVVLPLIQRLREMKDKLEIESERVDIFLQQVQEQAIRIAQLEEIKEKTRED